jgi:FkbM family methyltransferase
MNREHILPQTLLRSWPFPRGAGRLTDCLFSRLSFQEKIAHVRTTDGFYLYVMPNELVGRHIYLTGEFDRTTIEVISRFAKPNDVLIDIGANIGYVSACFLHLVPGSKAVSIEPIPWLADLLRRSLGQFGDRALVEPSALSSYNGAGSMRAPSGNFGASRLVSNDEVHDLIVQTKSADTFLSTLEKADIIKIDVEGHEAEIFTAGREQLIRLRPRLIFFEDHGCEAAPDGAIGSLLHGIGYDVFGVKKHLTRISLVRIRSVDDCRYNDYAAIFGPTGQHPWLAGSRSRISRP